MVEIFEHIRGGYRFCAPTERLEQAVEFYSESVMEGLAGPPFIKMFASWTPTFYINLGRPYVIDLNYRRHYVQANADVLILRNGDVTRHILPDDQIFTVKFFPGGLEAVLGLNQVALVDQVIDLRLVLPPGLLESLKRPITFAQRVALMESYLLTAVDKRSQPDHYVRLVNDCIGEYGAAGMQLNTGGVAERHFISSKTINRYFHRVIGTSPKNYFSILRGRTALTAYIQDRENFIPMTYGYYDLSHFQKDMVRFTGQRLTQQL